MRMSTFWDSEKSIGLVAVRVSTQNRTTAVMNVVLKVGGPVGELHVPSKLMPESPNPVLGDPRRPNHDA